MLTQDFIRWLLRRLLLLAGHYYFYFGIGCNLEKTINWKYFIPHVWELEKAIWEDIYLMPLENKFKETLWLSVNALKFIGKPDTKDEKRNEWTRNILFRLSQKEYYIDEKIRGEMYVSLPEFSQTQLVEYAKIYLRELGFTVNDLDEGTYEEFEEEINRIRS
jgi:hypothetical protein